MASLTPELHRAFERPEVFQSRAAGDYRLLPFQFIRLDSDRYIVTNFVGEHAVLSRDTLQSLVKHELKQDESSYRELKSKHFLLSGDSDVAMDLLATKYRTRQQLLSQFTSLFLFVVTLRCDHSCPYCQVSRQSADRNAFDMTPETAERAVEFLFRSPARQIKVEFQGGEPLLNFPLIHSIVQAIEARNASEGREIQFVIASNLAYLTDEMLAYCRDHDIYLSTSLDGPADLHNRNRARPGGDSHALAVAGIERARAWLGCDRIAALMTTTSASLDRPIEIIDEYRRRSFDSIFLRPTSPYGFAARTGLASRYDADAWLAFYRQTLDYILELNCRGEAFREEYASLLLRKILTPFATGYVDLQSPAGLGISCLVFNYDGGIYLSDESRMLAEMGDQRFRLGNLATDTFERAMGSPDLIDLLSETMTEGTPMCADCGFRPYCGSDPVQHYATQGDVVGFKPTSAFCRRNMEILRHLFRLLEDDPQAAAVLESWA